MIGRRSSEWQSGCSLNCKHSGVRMVLGIPSAGLINKHDRFSRIGSTMFGFPEGNF